MATLNMTMEVDSRETTTRSAPCFSPSTPRPWPPRFCPKEAEELSQLVLEEHGGGSLALMHERSLLESGRVDSLLLACSSYAGVRRKCVDWLIKVFYNHNLRDEWMVGVVTLLDRVAAVRGAASSANRRAQTQRSLPRERDFTVEEQAEWLAAMLCVLKLSSAEAELETIGLKELIFQIAELPRGSSTMWDLVVKTEFQLYRTLDYNVALPSSADLAGRIALDIESAARKQGNHWAGLITEEPPAPRPELTTPVTRFSLLVSFLIELGLTHIQDAVHGQGTPAVALALAAVQLALDRFGDVPSGGLEALEVAEKETLGAEAACLVPPLTSALHAQWVMPASGSRVIRKWAHRAQVFRHGALPKPSEQLPVRSSQAELVRTPERMLRRAISPISGEPKPKPSPRSVPKHTGPKALIAASERKLEAVPTAETAAPVVETSEDSEMLPAEVAETPVADKTVETPAKVAPVLSAQQSDVKVVQPLPRKPDGICDKEVQPENLAFLAQIAQLHSAQPASPEVIVSRPLPEPSVPVESPLQEAEPAAPPRPAPVRLLQRVPSAPVSPEEAAQLGKANPFGQPARSAMPAPLSVLVPSRSAVSRPSSTPSSPVQEENRYSYPSLSSDSKVGPRAMKLMDSGALRPPPSSTTSSLPSAVPTRPSRSLQRMDGSSVVLLAPPVTPPLAPVTPQVAPMEGVLPLLPEAAAMNQCLSSVCTVVEKRPPSENLLQRSRRVEKIEVSSISSKAQLKFAGAWEIHSASKNTIIGQAVVAGSGSYIKLHSAQGRKELLRIEGTGDKGKPFLVVDDKHGTYSLWDHQPAGRGGMERLTWKHSKEERYTMWVRTATKENPEERKTQRAMIARTASKSNPEETKTQRAMIAFRARKKAKSVGEDQDDLAQAFNNVIAGPPSKRRKLVSNCSNESTAAGNLKAVSLEANKENVTQNRPVPDLKAPVLSKPDFKGLPGDRGVPGDRGAPKTYGKRPRALPNSPEDEFMCY